jgi:hypothetical protein
MGAVDKIARHFARASLLSFVVAVAAYLLAAIITVGAWILTELGYSWSIENLELLADVAAYIAAGCFFFFSKGFVKELIEDWLGKGA